MKIGNGSITYSEDVDTLQFDWGKIHILSDNEVSGAEHFSFGIVETEPGKGHECHNHPDAEEVIFVLSGEAEQMIDHKPPVKVTAGACIHLPAGVDHSTMNIGNEPLKLLIVYSPIGAEKALRNNPDCKVIPAEKAAV